MRLHDARTPQRCKGVPSTELAPVTDGSLRASAAARPSTWRDASPITPNLAPQRLSYSETRSQPQFRRTQTSPTPGCMEC